MKTYITAAMLCAVTAFPTIAMAQEPDVGSSAGDAIVVTASRIPLEPRQVGSALSVITSDDLRQGQVVFLKDVLQDVAGLFTSTDRPGDLTSVSIRGSDNDQVLWLIDGIKLGDPSGTSTAFSSENLTTRDIARVEVLRGNQSSLYGSDAIGGVINIITQRATEDGIKVNAELEGGSYGTVNGGATVLGKSGPVDFRVTATGYQHDGPSLTDPRTANGPATEQDRYWRHGLSGRIGVAATDTLSFQVQGLWQRSFTDLDNTRSDNFETKRVTEHAVGAQANYLTLDKRFRADATIGRYQVRRAFYGSAFNLPTGDRFTGTRDNAAINLGYDGGIWGISAGGNVEREKTIQTTLFSGAVNQRVETKAAYGELALHPVENLTITGAARIDDNSRFGTFDTYRGTVAYVIPDVAGANSVKLRASYGTGAKAPGLYQLFDPTYGNPNLQVETSQGGDVGFDIAFDRFTAQISYFFTKTKNEIIFDGTLNNFNGGYRQFGRTRKSGVEVGFTLKPIEGLTINQSFTFLDAKVDRLENDRYTDLGRPRHVGSTSVTVTPIERLSLTARARYRSRNALSASGITAPYATVDLLASYGITDKIEVYGRVTNLLDKDYQVSFAKNALGQAAYGGVRVSF